jgi:hypothetical protein
MLSYFLQPLLTIVVNKKLLLGWLVLLSSGLVVVGDTVYVARTRQLSAMETKLEYIKDAVDKIDGKLDAQQRTLLDLVREQEKVRAELEQHEAATAKRTR